MKHRHKLKKLATCILSLALCGAMVFQAPGLSAQGAQPPQATQEETTSPTDDLSSALEEDTSTTVEEPSDETTTDPDQTQDPEEGEDTPSQDDTSSEEPSEPEEPEEPEIIRYTVTYQMGMFGTTTLMVDEGKIPTLVPSIPELPGGTVLGWFDKEGNPVDPKTTPITGDVTYIARWSRQVEELLNTEEHVTFISGYDSGLFLPDKTVSRAEAATMFYKLLLSTEWEKKTFPDVADNAWYADAVETLAGLGIVSGYENGNFDPNRKITRAEFVTMAIAFSTLEYGESSFTDVGSDHWAVYYIYTAAKQGWISGMGDGTFAPNSQITRAQAVAILNNMLSRKGPEDIASLEDVKNFYDLLPTHWAYRAIIEASTPHTYHMEGQVEGDEETPAQPGVEVWDTYEKDTSTVQSHWIRENGGLYYVDGATGKIVRGKTTINGVSYMFASNGTAYNGFYTEGSWRRYYQDGRIIDDISGLGVVSGPYYIKVYKPANYLIVFAKDPATGTYNTPVRSMLVSCGYGTPTGTYYTPARYRWLKMVGDTWAQWCTQIQGNYLFHSVPNWTYNNFDLEVGEYNLLGSTRSLGCIRLNCRDAKWIYDNCQLGTQVYISPSETSGPLSKPTGIKLPSWHTWDPTDPTAYYACQQRGCH